MGNPPLLPTHKIVLSSLGGGWFLNLLAFIAKLNRSVCASQFVSAGGWTLSWYEIAQLH